MKCNIGFIFTSIFSFLILNSFWGIKAANFDCQPTYSTLFFPEPKKQNPKHHSFEGFDPCNLPLAIEYCPDPYLKTEMPFVAGIPVQSTTNSFQPNDLFSVKETSGIITPDNIQAHIFAIAKMRYKTQTNLISCGQKSIIFKDPLIITRKQLEEAIRKEIEKNNQKIKGWNPFYIARRMGGYSAVDQKRVKYLEELLSVVIQKQAVRTLLLARNKKQDPILSELAQIIDSFKP